MKVMYVLGTGSKNDNLELRWSLRSLEKFCEDKIEPVIVGSVPEWFTGDYVQCEDQTPRKNKNILQKVMIGIQSGIVQDEEFLFSSDDHFLVKPYSFVLGPRWMKNPVLKELPISSAPTKWDRLTDATRQALWAAGYTAVDFEQHFNTYMRTWDVEEVGEVVQKAIEIDVFELGILVPSVFNNVAIANGSRRRIDFKRDVKFGQVDRGEIAAVMARPDCYGVSCNDDGMASPAFREVMERLFPDKSKWEK